MLPIQFTMIAAVGPNGELGKGDELIYKDRDDLKHFVRTTTEIGHVVVGRKTWNAIPDQFVPLKGRVAYVLSRNPASVKLGANPNVVVCRDVDELVRVLNQRGVERAAVIGGAEIYRLFAPMANKMILSHFVEPRSDADVFFPGWPIGDAWAETGGSLEMGSPFHISEYKPNKPLTVEKLAVAPFPIEYQQLQAAHPRPAVATAVATGPKDTRVLAVQRVDVDDFVREMACNPYAPGLIPGFWPGTIDEMPWVSEDFRERKDVEADPTYVQPIPYVILQRASDGRVLGYRRPSKIAENRLAGMRSIGFGGHIEPGDWRLGTDGMRVVANLAITAAQRELREEIGLRYGDYDLEAIGTVFEDETAVGAVHVGIVMVALVAVDDVHADEGEIVEPLWYEPADLLRQIEENEDDFERWSRLVGRALLVP